MIWICFTTYTLHTLSTRLNTFISNPSQPTPTAEEHFDKRELTSYELERLEREEEFDSRINRLKDELSQQQNIIRKGVTAEELHPSVHNLPHDTVHTKYDVYPDMEVAE